VKKRKRKGVDIELKDADYTRIPKQVMYLYFEGLLFVTNFNAPTNPFLS
jgi:hypothetical protein